MFVIIYQHWNIKSQKIKIYLLNDIISPVVIYIDPPFTRIDFAFIYNGNDEETYFIFKSFDKESHCEVKWKRPTGQLYIDSQ